MHRKALSQVLAASLLLYSQSGQTAANDYQERRVAHLFDRLAYGARPGDEERLQKQGSHGIEAWIEAQLQPETIPDDALEAKLSRLKIYSMNSADLLRSFQKVEKVAEMRGIDKEKFKLDDELKKKIRKEIGEENLPEEIVRELTSERLIRAVESRRQLQEVLVDFWLNHFNIDISKGEEKWMIPDFEKNSIRKHLFGKFEDLLSATAHSPAMLFYLDNQASQSPYDYFAKRKPGQPLRPRKQGLNENYARELLELHTLGVDSGYTQSDVTELARILTGWGIEDIHESPYFIFKEPVHDQGKKIFLGQVYPEGKGLDEGERAIHFLAHEPATARFISTKLARYFVSDSPPKTLIDRMAAKFLESDGDLKAVYRELFYSPEFWAPSSFGVKVKKPIQLVGSAIRVMGGELDLKNSLSKVLASLGEEPYKCPPPTGYPDRAEAWVNPGSMVSRLSFALQLSANRLDGSYVLTPRLEKPGANDEALLGQIELKLLHERMTKNSEQVILKEISQEGRTFAEGELRPLLLANITGLVLASPEFQKR